MGVVLSNLIQHITHLEEAFPLEVDDFVLPRPEQEPDEFVIDVDVEIEKVAEANGQNLGMIAAGRAVLVDDVAELEHLLDYVTGSFTASDVREGTGRRPMEFIGKNELIRP